VEQSDWHNDDVFQQSIRLSHWLGMLPESLPLCLHEKHRGLITHLLSRPVDSGGTYSQRTLLQFAALIHDVGKQETLTVKTDGTTHCPNHEQVSAHHARHLCARFDFSPLETQFITTLVREHGQPYALFKATVALPPPQQQAHIHSFAHKHAAYLLLLLLLACGDLITSDLPTNIPPKYEAVLMFYTRWLQAILTKE
jgi:hypothetical protein